MSSPRASKRQHLAIGCVVLIAVILLVLFVGMRSLSNARPEGRVGPEADALAREMITAVDIDAWDRTGAVAWDFAGRQQHLWDRDRQLARVRWAEHEVLIDLTTQQGRAWTDGAEVTATAERDALVEAAWAHWCNDSFWLNPIAKLFDDGVERRIVEVDDGRGLLVTYSSGGVTPGDSYLWLVDDRGLPTAWRMWTQILPIGGLEASWEGWTDTETGARIASKHHIAIVDLELSDVRTAATLEGLGEGDPFTPLVAAENP